jgi:hypothetical protein
MRIDRVKVFSDLVNQIEIFDLDGLRLEFTRYLVAALNDVDVEQVLSYIHISLETKNGIGFYVSSDPSEVLFELRDNETGPYNLENYEGLDNERVETILEQFLNNALFYGTFIFKKCFGGTADLTITHTEVEVDSRIC